MYQITVSRADISLFHIAARELGDATEWYRIAAFNGLTDPRIAGVITLLIPDRAPIPTDGVPPQ